VREILDAVFYVLKSGGTWRLLPHDFPPWKTVYHYLRLWRMTVRGSGCTRPFGEGHVSASVGILSPAPGSWTARA
jgi:transposase